MLYSTKRPLKASKVSFQNLRKEENGLVTIDQSSLFTKSYIPFINNSSTTNYVNKNGQGNVFVPYANAPAQKWVRSTHKNVQHGKNNVVKGITSTVVNKNGSNSDSKG